MLAAQMKPVAPQIVMANAILDAVYLFVTGGKGEIVKRTLLKLLICLN